MRVQRAHDRDPGVVQLADERHGARDAKGADHRRDLFALRVLPGDLLAPVGRLGAVLWMARVHTQVADAVPARAPVARLEDGADRGGHRAPCVGAALVRR